MNADSVLTDGNRLRILRAALRPSVREWYHILRRHRHWSRWESLRYAIWLRLGR